MPCAITVIDRNEQNSVPQASLPVTCKLNAPPVGITIAEADYFDATGAQTPLAITGGTSFVLPAGLPVGTGELMVRFVGPFPLGSSVQVVEDCPALTPVLFCRDNVFKFAQSTLEVL